MNQQEKLKICVNVLGWSELQPWIDSSCSMGCIGGIPPDETMPREFDIQVEILNLITTLGIATWQEGNWYASKNYDTKKYGIPGQPPSVTAYFVETLYVRVHKDHHQAVIDCVAGGKSG